MAEPLQVSSLFRSAPAVTPPATYCRPSQSPAAIRSVSLVSRLTFTLSSAPPMSPVPGSQSLTSQRELMASLLSPIQMLLPQAPITAPPPHENAKEFSHKALALVPVPPRRHRSSVRAGR